MMIISNIKKIFEFINYKIDYLLDKFFDGHVNIGRNITIYGRNAMKWGVNIYTKKYGYICFFLPIPIYGKIKKDFYLSPNATPWACTFYMGKSNSEKKLSKIRKECFGHNFNVDLNYDDLRYINETECCPPNITRNKTIENILE